MPGSNGAPPGESIYSEQIVQETKIDKCEHSILSTGNRDDNIEAYEPDRDSQRFLDSPVECHEAFQHQRNIVTPTPEENTDTQRRVDMSVITGAPYNEAICPQKYSEQYFQEIRHRCEENSEPGYYGPDPHELADYKKAMWPTASALPKHLAEIYETVRKSGLPNAIGAKMPLQSKLNLCEWERIFGRDKKHSEMLDFVRFGFPMGYAGPVSDYDEHVNHTSATAHKEQIDKFFVKEIELGGVIGPIKEKPFFPWLHTAPIMSRPKRDSDARRVIADLTYPEHRSINAYILKNSVWGETRAHSLPTVTTFVEEIKKMGPDSYMSVIDISRAYKNFRSDPLDWPLLCAYWEGHYYCDVTMPFGSRASSYHMQCVANAITDVLGQRGIVARMYLDDLITLAPDEKTAWDHHIEVLTLLKQLGLPVAEEKIQVPSRAVQWLGININTSDMTLSIPTEKINETLRLVNKCNKRRSMTRRDLQSVVGKLVHIAKCVAPARLFIARLLETLRGGLKKYVKVNADMRKDFQWFIMFCSGWNGIAMISNSVRSKSIVVDASMTGIGASDGSHAYAKQIARDHQLIKNITELEAMNIAVALHTFVDHSYRGAHIDLHCDNLASVQVMQTGRGQNKVLLDVARHIWMLQAEFEFSIRYHHIRGKDNVLADALSRAHLSPAMNDIANTYMHKHNIDLVHPCLFIFGVIKSDLFL